MLITSDKYAKAEIAEHAHTLGHSVPRGKPSICLVALNAFNVLSDRQDLHHVGGAEVQQLQIASWLVRRGYPVRFVTLDHGQPDGVDVDGIRVFKAYVQADGIRGLRFLHPRWSGLWAALKRADANVYYQRGAEDETGQVALWCWLHRRKFVFAAANDSDCVSSLYALNSRREKALYRLGLRLADAVTAQTSTQQTLLRKDMRVESVVIRNCGRALADRPLDKPPAVRTAEPMRVLWVGRISEQKRLDWLLDLAQRCPDTTFEVVGASNADSGYAAALLARAAGIPNVKMQGRVPYDEMPGYYRRCHILCCTSAYEGFPNTFLEAWSLRVPVISTFDPDGAIATHGLGWVTQDVEGMVGWLRRIEKSPEIWSRASQAAERYYTANHTPEACLPALERLLLSLAGNTRCPEVGGPTNP